MSANCFFVSLGWSFAAFVLLSFATTPLVNAYYDARVAAGESELYPKVIGFKWMLINAAISFVVFIIGLFGKLPFTR